MKHTACISYGKDSLAMLIKIIEEGLPLDEVVHCEIMFDEDTSGELPAMLSFIKKADKILKDRYNIEVTKIRGVTYKDQFFKVKKRGRHIGDCYGFPFVRSSWCVNYLKQFPLRKYVKGIEYVGIAYNEPIRYERLKGNKVAPLYDMKITEDMAMEICRANDLLSPIYDTSKRGGCWFCPKQRLCELEKLYKGHPTLWAKLKDMEKYSHNKFRPDYSITELEHKFKGGKVDVL